MLSSHDRKFAFSKIPCALKRYSHYTGLYDRYKCEKCNLLVQVDKKTLKDNTEYHYVRLRGNPGCAFQEESSNGIHKFWAEKVNAYLGTGDKPEFIRSKLLEEYHKLKKALGVAPPAVPTMRQVQDRARNRR